MHYGIYYNKYALAKSAYMLNIIISAKLTSMLSYSRLGYWIPLNALCAGHHDPILDGKKTRIPHTLNVYFVQAHCDPMLDENKTRILHMLNIYLIQAYRDPILDKKKAQIPYTP